MKRRVKKGEWMRGKEGRGKWKKGYGKRRGGEGGTKC